MWKSVYIRLLLDYLYVGTYSVMFSTHFSHLHDKAVNFKMNVNSALHLFKILKINVKFYEINNQFLNWVMALRAITASSTYNL